MIITDSILHIVDNSSGQLVFSSNKLDISHEEVYDFVRQKLDRIFYRDTKHGVLPEDNHFIKMLQSEQDDFLQKSKLLATHFYSALERTADGEYGDILVATCTEDDQLFYIVMKIAYQKSFTHVVEYDEVELLTNKIIPHRAIYRNSGIAHDEAVLFNLSKQRYKLQDKYYSIDGERSAYLAEHFLKLTPDASVKEQISEMKRAVKQTAKHHHYDTNDVLIEAQNAIYESIEETGKIIVETVGEKIFGNNLSAQSDYKIRLAEVDVMEEIVLTDIATAEKKYGMQKLKLDNGIELFIPVELYKDKSVIEFRSNEDGTTSVILKNIESINNRF